VFLQLLLLGFCGCFCRCLYSLFFPFLFSSQKRIHHCRVVSFALFQTMSLTPPSHPPFTINQTTLPLPLKHLARCLAVILLTSTIALAQQPQPRTTILLDPAHGGPDTGAHLPNSLLEKDITLTFSTRLRSTLAAAGFTVLSTRDADPAVTFTTDQRAEIGNHAHPTACLILHATSSGNGIHIVTSAQAAPIDPDEPHAPIPWDSAQAASVSQSLSLANEIGLALERAKLPTILSRASLRPLDNLTCPAVAIEIAPLASDDSDKTPVVDLAYQQNIAKAIASAITSWRSHVIAASGAAK
jgi:N-acetylmuramoyl-L-alanine amidase